MRQAAPALLLVLLLLLATVGSAESVSGSLRLADGFSVEGLTGLAADAPVVLLNPGPRSTFTLAVAEGLLVRTYAEVTNVDVPVFPGDEYSYTHPATTEEVPLSGATVEMREAREFSTLFLHPAPSGAASATAATPAALALAAAPPARVEAFPGKVAEVGEDSALYLHHYDLGVPHVATTLPRGDVGAVGAFEVFLFGIEVVVRDGRGETVYRSGVTPESGTGPLERERTERIVLRIGDGRLDLSSADPVLLLAPDLAADVDGTARLHGARGELRSETASWRAAGEDVVLSGAGRLAAAPQGSAAAPVLAVSVSGDLTPVGFLSVNAAPRPFLETATGASAAAAGGGLLILGVLGAVAWRRRRSERAPEGLLEDAVLRLDGGDLQGALEKFNAASAADPRNPLLHLDRAHVLDRLGRTAEARRAYELAVRCAPENGEAHYQLARSLAQTGLAPSAIAHLSRAFSLDPAFAEAARTESAFRGIEDHPTYRELASYYSRPPAGRA